MSSIKSIFIEMDNLTDAQQLNLWQTLWKFAEENLGCDKSLRVVIVNKDKEN